MSQEIKSSEPALPADEEVPVTPSLVRGAKAISAALKALTNSPGVYRMIDAEDHPLYVGKAKNLKKRVEAYTRPNRLPVRIQRMIAATVSVEVIAER